MSMVSDVTTYVKEYDPEVGAALEQELGRQRRNLELIASENIVTPQVMRRWVRCDKQVCGRISGKAVLRRMRIRGRD